MVHALETAFLLVFAFVVKDIVDLWIDYMRKNNVKDERVLYASSKFMHVVILILLDILIVWAIEIAFDDTP